ncbi:PaiB family negative transcriptional regulator [Rhodobacter sp. JA431]|uniref:FMN-binding negative transcriptional regulator n=1 Tax=Rhodobacter sp. JA431 TaxID=570013 RepID=UPI000BCA0B01|nr:FMN-binding negative transcriptional regulator [Rhodobacter sp. JA431]SOB91839.1 PaiB family negative transcriptional regulator [Rhodobacter sp. JA431]
MYRLPAFAETDAEALSALIAAHPLGLLISSGPGGIMAGPVPFQLVETETGQVLRAHLAKANPQLAELAAAPQVLVVFQPGEAYVSPSWYPTKAEHHRVVPTWNYAMVQVRGTARLITDDAFLRDQIAALTTHQEAERTEPWAVSDAPPEFITAQLRGITGLEIAITAMEGKLKLSQNRTAADRAGVRAGLMAEGDPLARLMPDPTD